MFFNRRSLTCLANILIFSGIFLGSFFKVPFSVLVGCLLGCAFSLLCLVKPNLLGYERSNNCLNQIGNPGMSEKNKVMEDLDREVARRRESVKFNRN